MKQRYSGNWFADSLDEEAESLGPEDDLDPDEEGWETVYGGDDEEIEEGGEVDERD